MGAQGQGLGAFRPPANEFEKVNPAPAAPQAVQGATAMAPVDPLVKALDENSAERQKLFDAIRNLQGVSPQTEAALANSYKPQAPPQFADKRDLLALLPLLFAPDRQAASTYVGGLSAGMQGRYADRQQQQAQQQAQAQQLAQQQFAAEEREVGRQYRGLEAQLGGLNAKDAGLLRSAELSNAALRNRQVDEDRDLNRQRLQKADEQDAQIKKETDIYNAGQALGNIGINRGNVAERSYDALMQRARTHNERLRSLGSADALDAKGLEDYVQSVYERNITDSFFKDYKGAANAKSAEGFLTAAVESVRNDKKLPQPVKDKLIAIANDAFNRDIFTSVKTKAENAILAIRKELLKKFGSQKAQAEIDKLVNDVRIAKDKEARAKAIHELEKKGGKGNTNLVSALSSLSRIATNPFSEDGPRESATALLDQAMKLVPGLFAQIEGELGLPSTNPAPATPQAGGGMLGPTFNIYTTPAGGATATSAVPPAYLGGGKPAPAGGLLNGGLNIPAPLLDRVFTNPTNQRPVSLRQVQKAFSDLMRSAGPKDARTQQAFRNLQYAIAKVQQVND